MHSTLQHHSPLLASGRVYILGVSTVTALITTTSLVNTLRLNPVISYLFSVHPDLSIPNMIVHANYNSGTIPKNNIVHR